MDTEVIEQLQRVTDSHGEVVLLELSASSFSAPFRIANDTRNWDFGGEEFIAAPFWFKLPDSRQDGAARAQLAIDNTGRGITDELENFLPGDTAIAHIRVCTKTDPLRLAFEAYIPVTIVSVNGNLATADCGIGFVTQQKAVKRSFSPYTAPGLF